MGAIDPRMRVRDLLRRWPGTEAVLSRYGLDLCCGIGLPVAEAARAAGADLESLLRDLAPHVPERVLDNRGLTAPEPLQRTLAAVAELAEGESLEAWYDRRPILLFPVLAARGFYWTETAEPEGVRLVITRGRKGNLEQGAGQ